MPEPVVGVVPGPFPVPVLAEVEPVPVPLAVVIVESPHAPSASEQTTTP